MKRILLILVTLACTFVPVTPARAQDMGDPDSLYFLTPSVELLNCTREVRVTLPLHLWTDDYACVYSLRVFWSGDIRCDTAFGYPLRPDTTYKFVCVITDSTNLCNVGMSDYWHYLTPGAGVIFDFVFRAHLGDTLNVWPFETPIYLGDGQYWWYPTYMWLDTSFVLPDTLAAITGDADCSGSVDISDAVFLITYIFAGGIPPYDRNAADENGDCAVDISDAVYLIAYIFSGGPAPQVGCTQ
jgi:hypothetical protein